jgi:hypothetical protein
MASFQPYAPKAALSDAETILLGAAFDAACKELHDAGQPEIAHEIIAKQIMAAASRGERDLSRLRDAGLARCERALQGDAV